MISPVNRNGSPRGLGRGLPHDQNEKERMAEEIERLRAENRRLAVSLGGFSAFIASKGLLEDAWNYVHIIHNLDGD